MEKRISRLKEGLAAFGIELDAQTLHRELQFLDELLRWSARINLTAIRNPQEGLEKHLLDSLALYHDCSADSLLDVGSGAGLPAIPLAIARPDIQVVSVESVGKKVRFQKHIRRTFGLENLSPLNCRVEELPRESRKYPLITARAFATISKIIELVSPLMTADGKLLLLRGREGEVGQSAAVTALNHYGLQVRRTAIYRLPFSGAQRQILEIERA